MDQSILDLNREIVLNDYQSATKRNRELFLTGDVKASCEYIFPNQKEDAAEICNKFYNTDTRVISIVKRTKVGMDGLMIELAKNMTTHSDNNFALHRNNIFFLTGMSNVSWENDMKDKIPACFKDNVYHHGKLQRLKTKLRNIQNAIIINDEIDSGDKEDQKLHLILKESGILDMKYMEENNIRFVFVSATMINELRDLYKWGDKHYTHYMTIPESYIGHKEFLELGIIQEYYPVCSDESAEKWIREDVIERYGNDFRIHLIRTDEKHKDFIFNACIRNKIDFKNHTSDDRISDEELSNMFNHISNHLVIAVKGFYRRANLIPNEWKKKIGATHERYVKKYDTNVQVQGFPGRMSGYWKHDLLNGHKTGPHRTSINAINEYEEFYKNPFGKIKYSTTGSSNLFVNPRNILNLDVVNPVDITTNNGIPLQLILDVETTNRAIGIYAIRDKSERNKQLHNMLLEGIQQNKIKVSDKNDIKLDISSRTINQVRMYKHGDNIEARRFKKFSDAHENYKHVSQSCGENQYNIDFAKDEYRHEEFTNSINTWWITYKY
jgi:hypothetical protein